MNPKNSNNSNNSDDSSGDDLQLPPEDFETFDEFQPIIALAKTSMPAEPPEGFTQQVMSRIAAPEKTGGPHTAGILNRRRLKAAFNNLTETESGAEIALCYLLAGFFYFVLAVVFLIGLKTVGARMSASLWISVQPQIAFVTAGGLAALGYLLLKDGMPAIRIAYTGTIVYILFSVFNGIRLHMTPSSPFTLSGILCFVSGAVLLGLFLVTTLHKYRQQILNTIGVMEG